MYYWYIYSIFFLDTETVMHTTLLLCQATVLNIAFNSYNNSLLIILMSNNVSYICLQNDLRQNIKQLEN